MKICGVVGWLAVIALQGCTLWPVAGSGGDAGRFPDGEFYSATATSRENAAYQLSQLETLQAQLDVLSLQGARQCLPASIQRMQLSSQRIRRQIAGALLIDAAHDLVIFQRELRFLRQQFLTVAQQTGCQLQERENNAGNSVVFQLFFDSGSDQLSPISAQNLRWWVGQSHSHTQWLVNGFADQQGSDAENDQLALNRANRVRAALVAAGVAPDNIRLQSFGELMPLLTGDDDFSMGMNRRVDVFVSTDNRNVPARTVQTWQDLDLDVHRHLWQGE